MEVRPRGPLDAVHGPGGPVVRLPGREVPAVVALGAMPVPGGQDQRVRPGLLPHPARHPLGHGGPAVHAERAALASGLVVADNSLIVGVGKLARSAPDDASPFFRGTTNRGALLTAVGQTYLLVQPTPLYHLNAPALSPTGQITGLRESSDSAASAWFAGGAPHQSMRESAEGDALWCGEGPLPIDMSLGAIQVPLFYLGAAGGFGDHGLYTTTLVGSTDVTTHVVRRFGPDREAEDFGHGDLLFAADAPTLAWKPLADWLRHH